MVAREKKEMKPLMLKVGVALALSLAGFLYSRFRTRRIRPPSTAAPSSEIGSSGGGQKDEFRASSSVQTGKYHVDNTMVGLSPPNNHGGDKDGLLLPEFDELVKKVDFSATCDTPKKTADTPRGTPKAILSVKDDDYEKEVKHLKNMVRILKERERNLEVQLLEYYGLKEQEKTVMELENRLKISNMEAKLLSLKIESLQTDNRRLEAQVADHAKVMAELEAAKGKIKLLKRKLRHEAEQNREHILTLQERVAKLRDQEHKASATDPNIESKLERIKDLENEAKELRSANLRLQLENDDLGQRLESTQIIATYVLEDSQAAELKQAAQNLKQENENLTKKIETLQADRCGDVEELVYLRWLNACLRFEMRNYQPPSGKTVARDLSRQLSPKSEEKAKKLILEYASTEDFDSDRWSSSQAYYHAEFDLSEESPVDLLSAQKPRSSKHKLFKKLKSLIKGKDSDHGSHVSNAEKEDSDSSLCSTATSEQAHSNRFASPPHRSKSILDIPRVRTHKLEQDGKDSDTRSSSRDRSCGVSRRVSVDLGKDLDHHREFVAEKSDLLKYAEALKGRTRRRSASLSSF